MKKKSVQIQTWFKAENSLKCLQKKLKRYQSGLIEAAQLIEELIKLAQDIRAADKRGEKLNLELTNLLL